MKEKIAGLSIFVNLILAVGKTIIGFLSNSASILAEGIHSGMDVLSSGIGFIGIKISSKPVDKKHPYGYYKFEVLSGLIITLILFGTGFEIIYQTIISFNSHIPLKVGYLSIGIMIFSALANEVMARIKIHYGKKENSVSLLSDGVHSRVDVYASVAILLGLIISKYWVYADSIFAFLVGLYIIKESFELGKETTDSLLDVSAGEEIESKIRGIVKTHNIKLFDLKTQKKGSAITANLVIGLPKKLSVEQATVISNKLRLDILNSINCIKYISIQIKSHELVDNFFEPTDVISKVGFGKGFGWQRNGKMKRYLREDKEAGPVGNCICVKCNYETKHTRGIPCSQMKCPKCGSFMKRK